MQRLRLRRCNSSGSETFLPCPVHFHRSSSFAIFCLHPKTAYELDGNATATDRFDSNGKSISDVIIRGNEPLSVRKLILHYTHNKLDCNVEAHRTSKLNRIEMRNV